jgi:hypothetical protein
MTSPSQELATMTEPSSVACLPASIVVQPTARCAGVQAKQLASNTVTQRRRNGWCFVRAFT